MKVVAIGSKNPVKIQGVSDAFASVWPKEKFKFVGVEVKSGVPRQPMSDLESIKGARQRARQALKILKADFGVGLEGGLQKIGRLWFDCGWVVIINKKGQMGIGSSLRMEISKRMVRMIKRGLELGTVNDILFGKKNSKQAEGHFGLMTKNVITRRQGYRDGVVAALARFIQPQVFGS